MFLNHHPAQGALSKMQPGQRDRQTDRGAGQTYRKVEEERMGKWLKEEVGRTRYSIGIASMGAAGSTEVGRERRENQDEVKKTGEDSREEWRMKGKMSMVSNIALDQGQRWPNHEEKRRFHGFLAGKELQHGWAEDRGKSRG